MTYSNILVINAGSSSEKISFYKLAENARNQIAPQAPIWRTEAEFPSASLDTVDWNNVLAKTLTPIINGSQTKEGAIASNIDIVGHRIVHGCSKYNKATLIDEQVQKDIEKYIPLAPLHNKVSSAQIKAIEKILPNAKQVAVFDTAFHRTLPEVVKTYSIPYEWFEEYDIQRFGFHGINHEYCAKQAAHALQKDISTLSLIVCHLGSGCSLAAVHNGKSVNTTMGFTPMEGLMMSSRSGSIDPGILIYLLQNKIMTVNELETNLNKNSGLKGIAKISDMKKIIEQMQNKNENSKMAQLAFDMFIDRLRSSICAMRASLPKLDALVFTAGIGENSFLVREKAMSGLEFLDLKLDKEANKNINKNKNGENSIAKEISSPSSLTKIFVINAQEDWAIAQQSLAIN